MRTTDEGTGGTNLGDFAGFRYGWDRVGNLMFEQRLHEPLSAANTYRTRAHRTDLLGRLVRWREGRTEKKLDPTDPTIPVTTEKPDTAVTSPSDGETSKPFEHDFLGQLRKNGRRNQEYTWDFFGRLTKVCEGQEGSCGAVATYRYDALNRRVEKVVEAPYPAWDRVTQFYHDGWRAIEERAIELEGTPQQEVEYVRARCGFGVGLDEVLWMDRDRIADPARAIESRYFSGPRCCRERFR